LFEGKVNKMTFAFLHIMLTKGRESLLPQVVGEFLNQYKQLKGISTITLTTATPASAEMIELIRKQFEASSVTKNTVEILTKTKTDLLGGFTIEFEDKLYDASIKHQLDQMRKQFGGNLHVKSI
jgi:F-type H+-transporting ATPase subunit delta